MTWRLLHGDCVEVLATMPADSVEACVTDPPYGIGFMGKEWDTFKPGQVLQPERYEMPIVSDNPNLHGRRRSPAVSPSQIPYDYSAKGLLEFQEWTTKWAAEVLRVLKPGGHVLVCGAPRSFHRMACGLEDAGFAIRDCLSWLYGQGFPKSLNLGDGIGTALKPGWEPIVLARKPFKGSVTANVATHGTGGLNIDACRIEGLKPEMRAIDSDNRNNPILHTRSATGTGELSDIGRWPANVALDEIAAMVLDEQSGELTSGEAHLLRRGATTGSGIGYGSGSTGHDVEDATYGDSGGASRFYYVAKPSREERDYGTDGLQAQQRDASRKAGNPGGDNPRNRGLQPRGNHHPTVKPVELMRWLVRLVTPIGGTVLDPFTGSGTTGMACRYEQRGFIGIEREAEYVEIARRRIDAVAPLFSEAVS